MNKKRLINITFLTLYIISIAIFFYLSLNDGEKSKSQSSAVTEIIVDTIEAIDHNVEVNYELTHTIVRKLFGHFSYMFLVGILGTIYFNTTKKRGKYQLALIILIGVFISLVSELLQFVPDSRGPSIVDFSIDLVGYSISSLITYILFNKKSKIV